MTGDNYWLVVGPLVIAATIVFWIALVTYADHRRRHYGPAEGGERRGPVSGGTIEGSPAQLNRRDEAPRQDD